MKLKVSTTASAELCLSFNQFERSESICAKHGESSVLSKYTIRTALGQLLEYYYKRKESVNYLCFVGIKPLGKNKIYFDYLKNIFKNEKFELKYFYVDYDNCELIEDK